MTVTPGRIVIGFPAFQLTNNNYSNSMSYVTDLYYRVTQSKPDFCLGNLILDFFAHCLRRQCLVGLNMGMNEVGSCYSSPWLLPRLQCLERQHWQA